MVLTVSCCGTFFSNGAAQSGWNKEGGLPLNYFISYFKERWLGSGHNFHINFKLIKFYHIICNRTTKCVATQTDY